MGWIIATILLFLFVVLLSVAVGFLWKALNVQMGKHAVYEQWILDTQERVEKTYQTMRALDDREMFAKDDEVGTVFQQIVELIAYLNEITMTEK